MEFWLSNGIFHRSGTLVNNNYGQYVPCYEDSGKQFIIPDESETIIIPEGTVEIGQEAFATHFHTTTKSKKPLWPNVKKVVLPSSIKKIAFSAFTGLGMTEINFPDGLESIAIGAFQRTKLQSVILPESVKEIGSVSFSHCSELREIVFPKAFVFPQYMNRDVVVFCPKLETVEIKEDIYNCLSFWGCESIKKVTIPNGVTTIGYSQFNGCRSLKEIIIPDTVTEIGYKAFENCTSLTTITISSKARKVDGGAFKGCTSLESITLKCAFKGFETAFSDSHNVKQVFTSDSNAGKAKIVFPMAQIFNLKGKLLFSPDNKDSKAKKTDANIPSNGDLSCPAINGELVPQSNLHKFTNYEYDLDSGKHSFHVEFRGSQTLNRVCKAYYANAKKKDTSDKLYDASELIRANGDLYTIEPHSGERIPTLSEDYEMMGEKRSYSVPLEPDEIVEYTKRFSSELACCLSNTSITKIVEYVPHKKNGTLAKNRTTMILKAGWADSEGNTVSLIAKNVSDNDLDLEIKKMYIGEEKYENLEAARIIGIIGDSFKRKK